MREAGKRRRNQVELQMSSLVSLLASMPSSILLVRLIDLDFCSEQWTGKNNPFDCKPSDGDRQSLRVSAAELQKVSMEGGLAVMSGYIKQGIYLDGSRTHFQGNERHLRWSWGLIPDRHPKVVTCDIWAKLDSDGCQASLHLLPFVGTKLRGCIFRLAALFGC